MQIDDTTLRTICAKAIFDSITPEHRQELLSKAISTLLTVPAVGPYGGQTKLTPLQGIFEMEVQNMARELVRERFKTDPAVKDLINGIVAKSIAAMAADSNVADEIARSIACAFARANRE